MTLAYTRISGNMTFIDNHYGLLRNWGDYLVNNLLTPNNQYAVKLSIKLSPAIDIRLNRLWADFTTQNSLLTNNQSNLALKGIIGIAAASEIASISGNDNDASQFNVSNFASLDIYGALTAG